MEGSALSFAKGQSGECSLAQDVFPTLGLPDHITEKSLYRIALHALSVIFCKVICVL